MDYSKSTLSRLCRFADLRDADRTLLLGVFVLVAVVRLGLWVLPFRFVQQIAASASQHSVRSRRINSCIIPSLVRAIEIAARRIPHASCLTQALAAQILLARHGHASTLRIGVLKTAGKFKAHAWLEHDGGIAIGDVPAIGEFTVLPLHQMFSKT